MMNYSNMDTDDTNIGSSYSHCGRLSHLLHRPREVFDDMEQPLDLSQRDLTIDTNQRAVNIDMEEPICQYTNCSCPLKHILSLDNNDAKNDNSFRPRCENSTEYVRSEFAKRTPENIESDQAHFHPKRRKIAQYNQTICRSSSDTNLYGYNGPVDSFRSFTGYVGEETNQKNTQEGPYQPPYWRSSQPPNTYPSSTEGHIDKSVSEVKSISKHAERLPKKRSHARNLSYENSFQKPQHSGGEVKMSRTPSPQSLSNDAEMSHIENMSEKHTSLPELNTGSKVCGEELRASIMAELHQDTDDEDVHEFRKRYFGALFARAKAAAKPGRPSSALDFLISDKCKNDLDFRPQNSHIDQIIRGEKPGKLCLMDIVELQVEIGLA